MWQSADDIASPTERVAKRYTVAKPVLEVVTPAPYPKVDWSCVNSRFIKNIPSPGKFPRQEVQGLLHIQKSNEWYVFAMDIANQDDQDKYTGLINELARYVECCKKRY